MAIDHQARELDRTQRLDLAAFDVEFAMCGRFACEGHADDSTERCEPQALELGLPLRRPVASETAVEPAETALARKLDTIAVAGGVGFELVTFALRGIAKSNVEPARLAF